MRTRSTARRARPCRARMRCCSGGLALAAVHEVFAEGQPERGGDRVSSRGSPGGSRAKTAGVGPAGFCRTRIRRAVDGGLCRTRPRSAPAWSPCAPPMSRPRCAPPPTRSPAMRSARVVLEVWGETRAARSRRQPKADARGAGLRRHRAVAAGGGAACAFDRGDAMDRARGAFAAADGRHGARRCSTRRLVRNRHGPVGRWIMEWKCDECLFSEPAAYPQPVAAAPAHRPHPAAIGWSQRRAG